MKSGEEIDIVSLDQKKTERDTFLRGEIIKFYFLYKNCFPFFDIDQGSQLSNSPFLNIAFVKNLFLWSLIGCILTHQML